MFVRLEPIHKTEEVILIDEIGRVITTLDMIDFFCEYVNNDLEPLIEDGYTFYSVDKRLFS
jgi:hypothetical protein